MQPGPSSPWNTCKGPTLKKLLRKRRQYGTEFSIEEVLIIARQVAKGLTYAHSKGIVHRDLKPANLMLAEPVKGQITEDDVVKITDFGVSRVVADSTLRQTGKRSGTLPYMSPEQFRGELCTQKSDIYSFACTLHELVSGSPPFTTGDIPYQILNVRPQMSQRLPRSFANALLRGLAKDPDDRYESVEAFVAALEGNEAPWMPAFGQRLRRSFAFGKAVVLTAVVGDDRRVGPVACFALERIREGRPPVGAHPRRTPATSSKGKEEYGRAVEAVRQLVEATLQEQIKPLYRRRRLRRQRQRSPVSCKSIGGVPRDSWIRWRSSSCKICFFSTIERIKPLLTRHW